MKNKAAADQTAWIRQLSERAGRRSGRSNGIHEARLRRSNTSTRRRIMAEEDKREGKMDIQAAMAIYKNLGTPAAPHKMFARMAGSWSAKTRFFLEPGKPPVESEGSAEQKMVLGGRFLQEEFAGDMMGSSFAGIGFTGYDNHAKKVVSTWMDSSATGILLFEGTASDGGKTLTQENWHDDPLRGRMKWRSVTRIVDDNAFVFEMFGTDKSGKEQKEFEIAYTRRR
jgi:hypothetical protein